MLLNIYYYHLKMIIPMKNTFLFLNHYNLNLLIIIHSLIKMYYNRKYMELILLFNLYYPHLNFLDFHIINYIVYLNFVV